MKINITVKDLYNVYKNNDRKFLDSVLNTYIPKKQDCICEIKSEAPNSQFELTVIDITKLYYLNDDITEIITFCNNNPINFSKFGYNTIECNDMNTFIPIFISISLYFGYTKEQINKVLPGIAMKVISKCASSVREANKILNKLLSNIDDKSMEDVFIEMLPKLDCDATISRWNNCGINGVIDIANKYSKNPYWGVLDIIYDIIAKDNHSMKELVENIIKIFPYKEFMSAFIKQNITNGSDNVNANNELIQYINNTINNSNSQLFESIKSNLSHKMNKLTDIQFLTAVCIISTSIRKSQYFNQLILAC